MLRRHLFLQVVLAAATLASGCLSPEGGASEAPGPLTASKLAVFLPSSTSAIRLNETLSYEVTVTPSADFSGGVAYSLAGAPAGVTATFTPPDDTIAGPTPVKVIMTLKSASDAAVGNGAALRVVATSDALVAEAPLALDVLAELLVTIPKGVDVGTSAKPNLNAFGGPRMPTVFIPPGTKLTFVNADAINHRIHSDGDLGIPHGEVLKPNGGSSTQTFNGRGTFEFRCHIHPNMVGSIVVR